MGEARFLKTLSISVVALEIPKAKDICDITLPDTLESSVLLHRTLFCSGVLTLLEESSPMPIPGRRSGLDRHHQGNPSLLARDCLAYKHVPKL